MQLMFPLAHYPQLKARRLDPRNVLSHLVSEPQKLLEAMFISDSILVGSPSVKYFYPILPVKNDNWQFLCSESRLKRMYFLDYMKSIGFSVDKIFNQRLIGHFSSDATLIGSILHRGSRVEVDLMSLNQFQWKTVAQGFKTDFMHAISGHGCVSAVRYYTILDTSESTSIDYNTRMCGSLWRKKHGYTISYARYGFLSEALVPECILIQNSLSRYLDEEYLNLCADYVYMLHERTYSNPIILQACVSNKVVYIVAIDKIKKTAYSDEHELAQVPVEYAEENIGFVAHPIFGDSYQSANRWEWGPTINERFASDLVTFVDTQFLLQMSMNCIRMHQQ